MKKYIIPMLVIALSGIAYLGWQSPTRADEPSAAQAAAMQAPEVAVTTVKAQDIPMTSELPGRTTVYQVAEIRPQVGGIVKERTFTEGTEVTSGDLLYQIDPATYETSVDQAKASLAVARANLEPAALKARRYKNLVSTRAVSQQDYEDAIAAFNLARANVDLAQAQLDAARIDLARTKVVAPITGRIGRSAVTPGALVTANQETALAVVQQLDPIYVDLTQSSLELLRLRKAMNSQTADKVGTTVRLILEDGSSYTHTGTLKLAEASVDESTGSVTLRAEFPNPDRVLLPGMYVRAVIEEGLQAQALTIPQQAVTRDAEGNAQALVVDADNTLNLRPLTLDRTAGSDWVVTNGLQAGDRVVIEGFQKAKAGMKVRVADAAL